MRVGVVSDSHGKTESMLLLADKLGKVDAWVHLGDFAKDSESLKGAPVYAVSGNCDYNNKYESEQVITLGGVRMFITHGNKYSPTYDRTRLIYRCEELNCSVVLYGHTHISLVEYNGGILALNPGSPSAPRGGRKPSIAVLEIEEKTVMPSIITA